MAHAIQNQPDLPRLVPVSVLEQFGFGRCSAYDVARILPKEIVVRFGPKRIRLHADKLREWIEAGGTAPDLKPA